MKYTLAFLFCTWCLFSTAQTSHPVSKNRRFSLGISFTPALSYRFITHTSSSDANLQTVIDHRNEREVPRFGFSAGLHFYVKLRDLGYVETGLGYAEMGCQTRTFDQFVPPVPEPGLPSRIRYRYNIRYLDIPLIFHLERGTGKIRFCASAGLVASITLGYTQTEIAFFPDGSRRENETPAGTDIIPVGISVNVGAGMNYHITPRFSWKIQPVVRAGILPTVIAPIAEFPFSVGLQSVFLLNL